MNISQSINKIYPELEFDKDFIVFDNSDGKGQQIKWLNKEVKQPTKTQLEKAWIKVEKELKVKEVSLKTGENILKRLEVESKTKVYEKILNELSAVVIANGTATDKLKEIVAVVTEERTKGAEEKAKL